MCQFGVGRPKGGFRQDLVDEDLYRPGLEQIDPDPDEGEEEARDRPPEKRPVITEHAAIDHGEIKIAESGFAIELAARHQGGPRLNLKVEI